jgi:hypothetical protein
MAYSIKDLGSKENPVRCSGEKGILLYLNGLFDTEGIPVEFKKLEESVTVDCYLLTSSDGNTQEVYFDKQFVGYHEKVLIKGLKTYKDCLNYKQYTNVKYFNQLLKTKGFTEDHEAFLKLWKLCGTLLCFGPGFYATTDEYGMPLPMFKMSELNNACELVVHTLAGLTPHSALPFSTKRCLMEFIETFNLQIDELTSPSKEIITNSMFAKCNFKHDEIELGLWVEVGEHNNFKKNR